MTTVNNMIARLESLNIKDEAFHAVDETKDTITYIQKEQLLQGLGADGKKLRRYRSRKYASAKHAINSLPGFGNPDLKLTGSFYAGFKTIVTPETFATASSDDKNGALVKKYDPFGLDGESKVKYIETLRPELIKNIKGKLKL